jgi:protein-S-isoprenylcysteine O-methyltransferase Ste14
VTTILGYLVVAGFLSIEGRIRSGEEAKSYERGKFDQRSTMLIGIAFFVSILALLASWLFSLLRVGRLPTWVGWLGVGIAICGLSLRSWANRVLGAFYTRTLKVIENQTIIRAGPYRLIRHPGYLGVMLMWVGAALATANWIVLFIVLISMLIVYIYRIETEEKMLISAHADYAEYRKHTWRLLPFVY